jgi:cysteine desulfurase/selenocysteine lyase
MNAILQTANLKNIANSRFDFPILQKKIHGKPLAYLDNSATTQKPLSVIEAITQYYLNDNANVHRGVHALSEIASQAYESARSAVRKFIHAKHSHEIIFTRGTTESINLLAHCFGKQKINEGDEIIVSAMEHHSNLLPWQMLANETGAILRIIPINEMGELDLIAFEELLNSRSKIVAMTHVSNVLGTINPVKKIIHLAHAQGVPVLLDGAQATPHLAVNVQELDCDFYAFSGHKMYAPTGIGVLYGKDQWLEKLPPYQTGGGMISRVNFKSAEFAALPEKFEAGTPPISEAIGLEAAINYINSMGIENIAKYENQLLQYANALLNNIKGLQIVGNAPNKAAVISFVLQDVHPHDIATVLDKEGVAVRAGHHCAMPLMDYYNLPATVRASLSFYNNQQDIQALAAGLDQVKRIFQ